MEKKWSIRLGTTGTVEVEVPARGIGAVTVIDGERGLSINFVGYRGNFTSRETK